MDYKVLRLSVYGIWLAYLLITGAVAFYMATQLAVVWADSGGILTAIWIFSTLFSGLGAALVGEC